MNKLYHIYVIVNLVNGKTYVGITSRRLVDRVAEHIARAKAGCRKNRLAVAMRKYGFENFGSFIEISCETEIAARKLETVTIKKYDSHKNGYNCNYGGHGNLDISDDIKRRIGEKQKGKVIPFESRMKMSAAKLGRTEFTNNLGNYAKKGNNLAAHGKSYEIMYPDGRIEIVFNLSEFCRSKGLSRSAAVHLTSRGRSHGYRVLRRFDGQSVSSYTQAGGSGGCPENG